MPLAGRRESSATSGPGSRPPGFATESVDDNTEVVEVPTSSSAGWRDVAEATGAPWVAPVLVDGSDNESYPTGEVTVRFNQAPSASDLERFEKDAGLRLVRRNEYVDTQVVLAPIDPDQIYLPDLCAELQRRDDVAVAWLSTRSRYSKA